MVESPSAQVNLGKNILLIRKKRGLTIKELASQVNVSASLLSQIERGLANPSISTMKAIADALQEPLYNFFLPQPERDKIMISRAASRQKYDFSPEWEGDMGPQQRPIGYSSERLSIWEKQDFGMLRVTLPPRCCSNQIARLHEDDEIAYVEAGTVHIQLGTEIEVLYPGDCVCILAGTPHRWINESDEAVHLIHAMATFSK